MIWMTQYQLHNILTIIAMQSEKGLSENIGQPFCNAGCRSQPRQDAEFTWKGVHTNEEDVYITMIELYDV